MVAVLEAESDLETVTPAATRSEVTATRGVDVVVLVAGPGLEPLDLLPGCPHVDLATHPLRTSTCSCEGEGSTARKNTCSCERPADTPRKSTCSCEGEGSTARKNTCSCEGEGASDHAPAWVVLAEDDVPPESVIAAGARGCLVRSSTPLQIGAAIRAAARGERADLDHPVTGPLIQRTPRAAPPLSEREAEVLRLVDAGLGNKHIAERLYLSLSSVKSHLSHTYGRLGVSGRAAAVAEARRQGLI